MIARRALFAGVATATLCLSSPASADDLAALRTRWESAHEYQAVLQSLIDWHDHHAWSAEVDYMLGTAACRTTSVKELGASVLRDLASCDIGEEVRKVVLREYDLCTHASSAPSQVRWAVAPRGAAGLSGKYWGMKYGGFANGTDNNTHQTLQVTGPTDAAATESRRVLRSGVAQPDEVRPSVASAFPSWGNAPKFASSIGYMVWAGPSDAAARVGELAAGLDRFENYLVTTFGAEHPQYWINVFLASDRDEATRAAKSLHGVTLPEDFIAYDSRADWSILMLDAFGFGTAYHEATHLVMRANFGNVPPWLDEGLASLFESSTLVDGKYVGQPNYRQAMLKSATSPPALRDLLSLTWADLEHAGATDLPMRYALARSFTLYLQQHGRLADVVKAVRQSWQRLQRTETDAQVVEKVLGESMDSTQSDFQHWLTAVTPPPPAPPAEDRCQTCGCLPGSDPMDGQKQECGPGACDGCTTTVQPQAPAPGSGAIPVSRPTRPGCGCIVGASKQSTRSGELTFGGLALVGLALLGRRKRENE